MTAKTRGTSPENRRNGFMVRLFSLPVRFYRKCISPLKPATCIYTPTCSAYMLEALEKFGALKGLLLGTRRILRCVPWRRGGFDPVPDNPKGDMKWLF